MDNRIVIDPKIHHGKPVIKGTRVPVARVLGELAGGMSIDGVMEQYSITRKDVQAAIAYAAQLLEKERHIPLPA